MNGRVAMVSGASRGIGRAIVETMLSSGWRVSAGLRDIGVLPRQSALLLCPYEARDPTAPACWARTTIDAFGRIDAVVGAAGILLPFKASEGDEAQLDAMLDINVKAPSALRAQLGHTWWPVVPAASLPLPRCPESA